MKPDAEGATREWVRAQPEVTALVPPSSVYFAVPQQDEPELPLIVLTRAGGSTDFVFDAPRIVFECWGKHKNEASTVARVLAHCIAESEHLPPVVVEGGEVTSGVVEQILPRPGASWGKRYEVQATMYLREA